MSAAVLESRALSDAIRAAMDAPAERDALVARLESLVNTARDAYAEAAGIFINLALLEDEPTSRAWAAP